MELKDTLSAKLILLAICLLSLLFREGEGSFVLAFFIAAGFTFVADILHDKRIIYALFIACAAAMLFIPDLVCFLPCLFYDAVRKKTLPALAFPVLAFAYRAPDFSLLAFIAVNCVLALFLGHVLSREEAASKKLITLRDEAVSNELASMQEKKALLEKQDMELLSATYAERNRIARDIHDNVGHLLSRAILLNGAMKTINRDENLERPIAQMDETLNEAMTSIRESVHDLHDDAMDLEAKARAISDAFTFCPVTLNYRMSPSVPRDVRFCLLQVLKEALANTAKHSDADRIAVSMIEHPALFSMNIEDNGTKKNLNDTEHDNAPGASKGIGLENMRERVRALNGTIRFNDDAGFKVFLTIPKSDSGENKER